MSQPEAIPGANPDQTAAVETGRLSLLFVRAATAEDQPAIRMLVREAGINPLNLHWANFLVVQDGAEIVAIGQIKPYRGGRELASIATVETHQGKGIASALIRELLRREEGVTWLMCMSPLETFYQQFGYTVVSGDLLPPAMRRLYRLGRAMTSVSRWLGLDKRRLLAMRRLPTG